MTKYFSGNVTGLALLASLLQPPDSIVDAARRNGGSAIQNIDILAPIGELGYVTSESTLILRGIVQSVTPRLADDERIVVTEYEITPTRFYKGSFARVTKTPGATAPVVVQQPGGTLTVDNLLLKTSVNEFPEGEFLTTGEDVFVFLAPADLGRYRLQRGPYGAFRIADGQVKAMTRRAAASRHDEPKTIDQFEHELFGLLTKQ